MKLLVLMVLGCSVSTICAADVAVMRPPSVSSMSIDSPRSVSSSKSDQFKESIEVALYMRDELDNILATLGDAAYQDACDRIGDLPFKLLTKENLQKVFDDIRKGIKKAAAVKLSNTEKLENVLKENTNPSWGLDEFEKDKDTKIVVESIKSLSVDSVHSDFWDQVIAQIKKDISKPDTNKDKLDEAVRNIKSALDVYYSHAAPGY